jgi:phosphopantothenoylcysteine decarboxylase/phosphopantothenate--cysteine ligase
MSWDFSAPSARETDDTFLDQASDEFEGCRIALMISGSIAAYRAPDIVRELRRMGADVQVYASQAALMFVTRETLEWTSGNPVISSLSTDGEHLGGEFPFDLFLVAPATYNTINKFAQGIADDVLPLTLASALGRLELGLSKIAILPCMHGSMHNAILIKSLKNLESQGVWILEPRQEDGKDKLPEPEQLCTSVAELWRP